MRPFAHRIGPLPLSAVGDRPGLGGLAMGLQLQSEGAPGAGGRCVGRALFICDPCRSLLGSALKQSDNKSSHGNLPGAQREQRGRAART